MVRGEVLEVTRIVREDQASAETNCRGHDQRIDGHLAPASDSCKQVTGDPGDAHPRGHHSGEPATEHAIYCFVRAATSVELDEHGRRHTHRLVAPLGGAQRGSDPFVPPAILTRAGQG